MEKIDQVIGRMNALVDIQRELESVLQTLVLNDSTIIDALAQLLGAVQQMTSQSEEIQKKLAEEVRQMRLEVTALGAASHRAANLVASEAGEFERDNPEIGVLAYLAPAIADPIAIDVGANAGEVSARLLKAGYSVYAFEPYQPAFDKLAKRLGTDPNFHAFPFAIGPSDATRNLHIAKAVAGAEKYDTSLFHSLVEHSLGADLTFDSVAPVTVRSIDSLRRSGEIPARSGILKIDTEGFDLEVIRGIGDANYPVVMTEYWDPAHVFGVSGHGSLPEIVAEMSRRGYGWYVVIYHLDEAGKISYYCNRDETISKSWGNAIFFRDHSLFARAVGWLEGVLRPTLFG